MAKLCKTFENIQKYLEQMLFVNFIDSYHDQTVTNRDFFTSVAFLRLFFSRARELIARQQSTVGRDRLLE